jgi:protocatechuate 3,4-dioxygenase beta subunit
MVAACSAADLPTTEFTTAPEAATSMLTIVEIEATAELEINPIEVTYFTPSQQEGPYYPVDKPADRDNDLVDFAEAADSPVGDVLVFSGIVYDRGGMPVEGVVIEIWQTDHSGVYLHPNDPKFEQRDPNFQFYGEARTGADGVYSFRTILPGLYEPRPRHIHSKITLNGAELLTTQFYFSNEGTFSGAEANLVIEIALAEDDKGNPIWVGERDIILDMEL